MTCEREKRVGDHGPDYPGEEEVRAWNEFDLKSPRFGLNLNLGEDSTLTGDNVGSLTELRSLNSECSENIHVIPNEERANWGVPLLYLEDQFTDLRVYPSLENSPPGGPESFTNPDCGSPQGPILDRRYAFYRSNVLNGNPSLRFYRSAYNMGDASDILGSSTSSSGAFTVVVKPTPYYQFHDGVLSLNRFLLGVARYDDQFDAEGDPDFSRRPPYPPGSGQPTGQFDVIQQPTIQFYVNPITDTGPYSPYFHAADNRIQPFTFVPDTYTNEWQILTFSYQKNKIRIRVNGRLIDSDYEKDIEIGDTNETNGITETPGELILGDNHKKHYHNPNVDDARFPASVLETGFHGEIAAFIGYDHVIDGQVSNPTENGDIEKIEGYYAHKFNLTNILPSDHPFKVEPPVILIPEEGDQDSLVTDDGPFSVLGYYPLYRTKTAAIAASPTPNDSRTIEERGEGKIGYHTHTLNGVVYYMPNGLDDIGQQFHGDYGINRTNRETQNLRTGIDSIDQQKSQKNYRYSGYFNESTITSSSLNEFEENIRMLFSFMGDANFAWPYYTGGESRNARVSSHFWNGACPLYPDRISLGSGLGIYTETTISKENPIRIFNNLTEIQITFREADYFSVDTSKDGDGFRYPIKLLYGLSDENNFKLTLPKLQTGKTIVGLKVEQNYVDSTQDSLIKPKGKDILGPTRVQINFTGVDYVNSSDLEDVENFAPVFYIDHLNKEIRYMNNLLITRIS